jgi:hypothetical protein
MSKTSCIRVRGLVAALAAVSTLMIVAEAPAQPMGPAPGIRSPDYATRGPDLGDYPADHRGEPGPGASARYDRDDRGAMRHRYRGRRARAHPVHPRPECELGLHGCLGRDGLYHGKF